MSGGFQPKSFKILLLFFLTFTFHTNVVWAKIDRIDEKELTLEQKLIDSNIAVSKWFENMAEGIDLFLVDKQLQTGRNQTNVKIENSTYSVEGQNLTNETSLIINPRFPNLEKYWNLKFTTYDEQEDGRGASKTYLRQAPRQKNYGATVGLFKKFGKIRTAFQPRIELQDPLNVSHSLAFETVAEMAHYKINPRLEFFASALKGTGIFQAINFNFTLNQIYSLTLINEGTYIEKLHSYSVSNGVSLGQGISQNDAVSYSFFVFSNNRDNYHLDSYSLAVSWYHVFYKKILDFQLTPHLDFSHVRGFSGLGGVTFQVTINF